ncbi:hypothetical protein GQ53DRAFT_752278 [Thozetella sp. PMI_491]|nr:hypothetical protein GQ53DRAFT_752278 [Thozetella sp. PMI_491]
MYKSSTVLHSYAMVVCHGCNMRHAAPWKLCDVDWTPRNHCGTVLFTPPLHYPPQH